jgi:hypothetical protein
MCSFRHDSEPRVWSGCHGTVLATHALHACTRARAHACATVPSSPGPQASWIASKHVCVSEAAKGMCAFAWCSKGKPAKEASQEGRSHDAALSPSTHRSPVPVPVPVMRTPAAEARARRRRADSLWPRISSSSSHCAHCQRGGGGRGAGGGWGWQRMGVCLRARVAGRA